MFMLQNSKIPPKKDARRAGPRMTLHRRGQIVEIVLQRGMIRVDELAGLFHVSEVTIRNDLAALERDGQILRDRGGALAPTDNTELRMLLGLEHRAKMQAEQKRRIGQTAAQLVDPTDTIILDAGTTVVGMAPHLPTAETLTVVTNALNCALMVAMETEARLIVLGGALNRESSSTLGPLAEKNLEGIVVDKLFLGAQAMSLENGLTDTTMEIAHIKSAMLRSARQVILLADSSKWGRAGFIKVAPLEAVHTLITDGNLPMEARVAIQRLGINLILA
jgi:DeoR/GlpR family transcriptional regulator of sugar metabolism